MEFLAQLLSQPITQLGGIVAVAVALQKMGVDVKGLLRTALGSTTARGEIDSDNRNAMQTLLINLQGQMQELSLHFNHETTIQWDDVKELLKNNNDKNEQSLQILKEIKEYGIKCRKD